MNLFTLPLGAAAIVFMTTAASACPWANGSFKGGAQPDIDITVTFDAKCTALRLVDSGGKTRNLAVKPHRNGWQIRYDGTTIIFYADGKTAKGRRGGAQRTVQVDKL